ncbi:aspartate-semialdehyde dehydrogenase [Enterococcus mundtii]|uniref:aspartate-semialdehyde dehydrogenase n=1 Tax=Enterococcus mundtii TaxID=53346 RepID=UPI00137004F2|nr:aspartate-semialdehyde dehydrogenase [Enterococcus mundtii]NAA91296.1 aspartate-semialdehyde dehydrogenase [Enterococcus mundtii]
MREIDTCIVGATGLVGQTMLRVLEEYDFPVGKLKLLASKRSAGSLSVFKGKEYVVEELTETSFSGYDLALFSAGASVSQTFGPIARQAGLVVIDNSSAWREDPTIPLIVPEVNLEDHTLDPLIANPNCSTIQSVLPLKALQNTFGVTRVNYTTYQAVSGSGQQGIADLQATKNGEPATFYPHDISQTVIPEIDRPMENGYTKEEQKMINETKKILHQPDLPVSATCVRVPIENGHGVSIAVELEKEFSLEQIRACFSQFPGILVVDNLAEHQYPTSTLARGTDHVYVGRIRRDLSVENGLLFYTVADNIRKGAAANAVQIALALLQEEVLS